MGKYDGYIVSWKARLARERSERQRRTEKIRGVAAKCAEFLGSHYGVKTVYVFGSLIRNKFVHDKSDIDLAVEGLPAREYFSALNDLWDLVPPGVEIDLVPLEDAHERLRERISKEGKLLYERK